MLQLIGQSATDRPDLVACVFYQKQQALLQKIQKGYYGPVVRLVYTIKYQKHGLSHMHLLIFLEDEHKILAIEQIDAFIFAQIPDPIAHPQLYDAVSRYMIHNCSPQCCVENGRCKKYFPKSFCQQTVMKDDGYPEYARPDNGRTIQKVVNNNAEVYTNEQVVPHPRELIVEFDSHINLEVCASIKSIKYVHKYIYKGPDRATLQTQGHDEVKAYLDSRYISSVEAAWRLFEFGMHLEWPSVYRLSVHLENQQSITYQDDDDAQAVLEAAGNRDTTLTGWFKANLDAVCIEAGANDYLYQDFPKKFV